jgi:hypothetical protein
MLLSRAWDGMGKNAIAKGCKDSKDCKDNFSLTQEYVITEITCEMTYLRVRSQTTLVILASLLPLVPNRVGCDGEEQIGCAASQWAFSV